jgi:hypothetical protein
MDDEEALFEVWLRRRASVSNLEKMMVLIEREVKPLMVARDRAKASEQKAIEYSIKLQRLIENLKYPNMWPPYPELHHHKMIVAAKAAMYGHAGSSPAPVVPQGDATGSGTGVLTVPQGHELNEWDQYEEDGPLDLEDQLENALDRAFPAAKEGKQGDLS